jgi:broad specificity phosphatase PhoE
MKLYCMRHAETNYNRLGLCNDDPAVDVHLTETGIRQAERAAERLRQPRFRRIITSELPRTRQTAAIINRFHHVPVQVHPALNDIRTGFEGRPVAEYFAATGHDRLNIRIDGGESALDYKARVLEFVAWLERQPPVDTLVVAHEETLRVLDAHYRRMSDAEMLALNFGNCAVLEFDVRVLSAPGGAIPTHKPAR